MTNVFNLLKGGEKTLAEALASGKIPFTLISLAIEFGELIMAEKSFDLLHLKQDYANGTLEELYNIETNINDKGALIDTINHLAEQYDDTELSLHQLKLAGLQVEVEFYKKSGKYAYGGLVSLGEGIKPWDNDLLSTVKRRQKVITGSDFSDYTVVVRDTAINHNDRNYAYCMNRVLTT